MFTQAVNIACKQIVENHTMDEMHPTAARLYEAAKQLTKGEITAQVDVAAFYGVTSQVLNNWEKRGVSKKGVVQACSLRPINMRWLEMGDGPMEITGSLARVAMGLDSEIRFSAPAAPIELEGNPDFPSIRRVSVKAQAGIAGYAIEDVHDTAPIVFRADWYKSKGYRPERMMALRVAGESMLPGMGPDDLVVVNTDANTPKDGCAYLVAYYGEVIIKRLIFDEGVWWLCSDNPDQRRYPRKRCDDGTQIIGEVVYKQSERV